MRHGLDIVMDTLRIAMCIHIVKHDTMWLQTNILWPQCN